jgi:hypothetical protein
MKKLFSVFLCLAMLLTLAVPAFASDRQGTDIPNVYLQGQGSKIVLPDNTPIFNGADLPEGFLSDAVKDCMGPFATAVKDDTPEAWAAYREKLQDKLYPIIGGYALGKDGKASDGSVVGENYWDAPAAMYGTDDYKLRSHNFYQDWRLDPFDNADKLNDYIQHVKDTTGERKINLIGRCEGANVILAYLDRYGYGDLNCVELYVQSASGTDIVSALFSGKMQFDAASIRRFMDKPSKFKIEDEIVKELLSAALEFTGDTLLLDAGTIGLAALAPKIYEEVIVYILRDTYGTMPGIWSLVGADYYQAARKGVFTGYEEEYAGLIEKLDYYDAHVRQRAAEIVKDAVKGGVKVANYCKYGDYQLPPLCPTNDEINDNTVALKNESFGATTAKIGYTLSDSYIAAAKKNGTDKYISPDKMVDASTCALPDTTWFFYGSPHTDFPEVIHNFMLKFLKANGGMTVFTDEDNAPQYMLYEGEEDNGDSIKPMAAENAPTLDSGAVSFQNVNWKDMIMRFFNAILNFLKQFLAKR